MNYALIRPDAKKKGYGELSNYFTSIEPPLWLAMRAAQLKKEGHYVVILDQELNGVVQPSNIDFIEFVPFGIHPSGFIQSREGVKEQMYKLGQKSYVKCWNTLPEFDINLIPDWRSLPVDKYRCHANVGWGRPRSPSGVLFTSFSCPYQCGYCVIKEYYGHKRQLRDIDVVIKDIQTQIDCGIRNIKIIDELFLFEKDRVVEICDKIVELGVPDLNMSCFVRVDTCSPEILCKMHKAGINWVGIGIESGNLDIRQKEFKANFSNERIIEICRMIRDCGINICANFMYGFEDDTLDTMKETYDLSYKIMGESSNYNCLMAYEGTKNYQDALAKGWRVARNWSEYAQQGYECYPLRTNYLTSEQVLAFRDKAFMDYNTDPTYLSMIENKFGKEVVREINDMTSIKLKRKILGD